MLTRSEKNELLRKLDELHEAWENYVREVAANADSRFGAGALVSDKRDELLKYIKEELS